MNLESLGASLATAPGQPTAGTSLGLPTPGTGLGRPTPGTGLGLPTSGMGLGQPTLVTTPGGGGAALVTGRRPSPISPAGLAWIVRRTVARGELWRDLVRFDPAGRWYRRLQCDDVHEVWLLTWLPGQQTGFHDHGESAGAFAIAGGRLTEQAAVDGWPARSARKLRAGSVRSFGSRYVHDVRNDSLEPAVSVHAYSPPLTSMRRYDVGEAGLLLVTAQERSW